MQGGQIEGSRRRRELGEARRRRGSSASSARCASRRLRPVRPRRRGPRPSRRSSSSSRPGSVAQSSLAADLADDWDVRGRRRGRATRWDTYFERLQAQAACAPSAREQSEAAISDLRRRRNTWPNGWPNSAARRARLGRAKTRIGGSRRPGAEGRRGLREVQITEVEMNLESHIEEGERRFARTWRNIGLSGLFTVAFGVISSIVWRTSAFRR